MKLVLSEIRLRMAILDRSGVWDPVDKSALTTYLCVREMPVLLTTAPVRLLETWEPLEICTSVPIRDLFSTV